MLLSRRSVAENCMCSVCTPKTELALPHCSAATCIHIPRRSELLRAHVHTLKDVQSHVLIIDEVRTIDTAILIVDDGNVVVCDTAEAEIEHTFAVLRITQSERHTIA